MDKFAVLNNIEIYTDKFNETGFFPHAMQVFILANSNGLPIPKEILDAIEKGFAEWWKCDGKKPLEEIFNLKAGKGNTSALAKEWKNLRNKRLFTIMAKLMFLGWKDRDASEAACRWLEEQYIANPEKYRWLKHANTGRKGDNDTQEKNFLSPDSLLKEKRNNKKLFAESQRDAAESMIFWDDQKKQTVEKFYLQLINVSIEKENPKTTEELLKILVN